MKKYKYALNQYVSDIIFPKERVKDKVQILEILLEASRYILSAPSLTFDKNLGSITLVVDKMSRLFFCKEKKGFFVHGIPCKKNGSGVSLSCIANWRKNGGLPPCKGGTTE